jgi:hypothetical protein
LEALFEGGEALGEVAVGGAEAVVVGGDGGDGGGEAVVVGFELAEAFDGEGLEAARA